VRKFFINSVPDKSGEIPPPGLWDSALKNFKKIFDRGKTQRGRLSDTP
jgi:hypothetical protein